MQISVQFLLCSYVKFDYQCADFRKCVVKNSITDFHENPAKGLVIDNRSQMDGETDG